jgi:hypothetical protein
MNQPNIRAVQAGSARTLIVTWTSGVEHIIDVGEIIDRFVVFKPLRTDDAAFQTVRVGDDGGCVQWTEAMELSTDRPLALETGAGRERCLAGCGKSPESTPHIDRLAI